MSRNDDGKPPRVRRLRGGTVGSITRASVKDHPRGEEIPLHEKRHERAINDLALPEHPAYVGISISAGMSTQYAMEKAEATAWCSLPCGLSVEERADAFQEAKRISIEEAATALEETLQRFFPHLVED